MSEQDVSALKTQLKELLVAQLSLVDVRPEDIVDAAPLFGEGLGLDSLDAVEIVVLLQRHYGITLQDAAMGRQVFQSIDTLADYIKVNRTK
ncbi:MAG TPA: acyl carrier protein [Verrucomicrobia bacterium]|nr:MAG: acyl carrier protein [Lentisphaerae bacterium GWF2_57_35]HBA86357.1 acyl carrier protein [Verrucomicrobiota bacterium]